MRITAPPKRARLALALTSVISMAIVILSLTPLPELPTAPGSDKLHHLLAYSAAVLPVALWHRRALIWVLPVLAILSGAIELIQPLLQRHGEWADAGANLSGLAVGTGLGLAMGRR